MDTQKALRIANAVLDSADRLGALYADVRMEDSRSCAFAFDDGRLVPEIVLGEGIGVRVLAEAHMGGRRAWGFSNLPSYRRPNRRNLHAMVQSAMECAKAGSRLRTSDVELAPRNIKGSGIQVVYETPVAIESRSVSFDEKIDLLKSWDAILSSTPQLVSRYINLEEFSCTELLAISENGERQYFIQTMHYVQVNGAVIARKGSEDQRRSFDLGNAGGFEFVRNADVTGHCQRIIREVQQLLAAPECPEGRSTILLMQDQAGMHEHEDNHGREADRVPGLEMTYMGDSYLGSPEILRRIGSFKVASPLVTIVANATIPGGYGTYAFDHEGILSEETIPLVRCGIWQGLLLSREMVAPLNKMIGREYFKASNGMARAEGCDRIPLVRQANTELLPGPHSLEDLIGGIDHGFVFSGPDNWSMTFSRDSFAFGVELGHEVRNGNIIGVVRNPGYMGNTQTFWKSCIGIGNESITINFDNCGKGDPAQTISTAHRTPPVLFEDVRITNRKQIGNGGGNVRQR